LQRVSVGRRLPSPTCAGLGALKGVVTGDGGETPQSKPVLRGLTPSGSMHCPGQLDLCPKSSQRRRVIADECKGPMPSIVLRFPADNPDKLCRSADSLATAIRTEPIVNGHRVRLFVGLRLRRSRRLHCASCRPAGEATCRIVPLARQNLWPATRLTPANHMPLFHCRADQI
jgi:hypothetical protein